MENKDLIDYIKEYKENLNIDTNITDYVYYDNSDYICDAISSYADGSVDIYNSSLIDWLAEDRDNIWAIEEALSEFGTPKDSNGEADFFRIIQQGQFLKYERDAHDQLDDVIKFEACRCLLDLLAEKETNKTIDDFEEFIDNLNIDSNDRCDDILDRCNEFVDEEE